MEATFWRLGSWCTEHIRSVHDMHRVTTGYLFKVTISTAHISSNGSHFFPAGFLEYWPYKVSKIGYGLFSYALQPAKRTSASFMGAILEEYLVMWWGCQHYFKLMWVPYNLVWDNVWSFPVLTESQELGTLSRYHNSCLLACLLACPSPPKRLRDFIIN